MPAVCIVEDDEALRELLRRALAKTGIPCLGAYATGEAALAAIPKLRPDVVLMDIKLPGMDGIQCTHKLRALLPKLAVMMLTEHEDNEQVFGALRAGACGYLVRKDLAGGKFERIVCAQLGVVVRRELAGRHFPDRTYLANLGV